jgi:hypothetical protein
MKWIVLCLIAFILIFNLMTTGVSADDFDQYINDYKDGSEYRLINHRPYLYFTGEDMDRIKGSKYAVPGYLDEDSFSYTYIGTTTVQYKLPPEQPEVMSVPKGYPGSVYPYWTMMSRTIEDRLKGLALSYVTTGKREYADKAIEYALALSEWSTWTNEHPGYNNPLSISHITHGMATVYDLLYDVLTPEERVTIEEAILNRGLKDILELVNARNEMPFNNTWALLYSSLGLGGLAIMDNCEEALDYVKLAKAYTSWWLDYAYYSGQTEGVSYTSYGLRYLAMFLVALENATGDNELIGHPFFADHMVPWLIYSSSSDFTSVVNFSDSASGVPTHILKLTMQNLRYGNEYAGWLLKRWGVTKGRHGTSFPGVVYNLGQIKATLSPNDWSTARAFPMGWTTLRTGWNDRDSVLIFNSSPSKQWHNHFDQNNFVFNVNGQWLITEAGARDYANPTYYERTEGHNCLMVNNYGQTSLGGDMLAFADGLSLAYVVGDATSAYRGEVSWKRHILLVKPADYYILIDEVESQRSRIDEYFGGSKPRTKEMKFLLHTPVTANVKADGKGTQRNYQGTFQELTIGMGHRATALWKLIVPDKLCLNTIFPVPAPNIIRFEMGPEEEDRDFLMVTYLKGNSGSKAPTSPTVVVSDEETRDDFIGLHIKRDKGADIIILNRSGKEMSWNGVETDGDVVCISFSSGLLNKEKFEFATLIGGTYLKFNGQVPAELEKLEGGLGK